MSVICDQVLLIIYVNSEERWQKFYSVINGSLFTWVLYLFRNNEKHLLNSYYVPETEAKDTDTNHLWWILSHFSEAHTSILK